jgi:hypothetical protein
LVLGDTKGKVFLFDYNDPQDCKGNPVIRNPYQIVKAHSHERIISLYYDNIR